MSGTKLVRLTILIQKLDSITYDEFHNYWKNEHPKAWLSVAIVQKNVVNYSQVCMSPPPHIDFKILQCYQGF